MNDRASKILISVVREYIKEAEPIGSELLFERARLGVSPATIRNELFRLTHEGFLDQPHTSSGRVPTNKGYRFYVDEVVEPGDELHDAGVGARLSRPNDVAEWMAKTLGLLAFAFSKDDGYFVSGVKQLFAQPDFASREQYTGLANALERLHDATEKFIKDIAPGESEIFIGEENPYLENDEISSVLTGLEMPRRGRAILGVIGPTRIPYERCWKLIRSISKTI